jgi:amino acid transporter
MRAIKRYLFWGSLVVMVGYLWATFGTMMNLPASKSTGGLSDIFAAVEHGFWGSHTWAVVIALIALWFFVSNTIVYNYSFSRLLFVSGLERRMPTALGRVNNKTKVPVAAIIVQTVLASGITIVAFGPWFGSDNTNKIFWMLQAAVTVIWCVSMVLLFADIFLVKRAFPQKFEEVRVAPTPVLYASALVGIAASVLGAFVTFKTPWVTQWTTESWRVWLAIIVGVSAAVAIMIYAISEFTHRRELPTPTPTPAA